MMEEIKQYYGEQLAQELDGDWFEHALVDGDFYLHVLNNIVEVDKKWKDSRHDRDPPAQQ